MYRNRRVKSKYDTQSLLLERARRFKDFMSGKVLVTTNALSNLSDYKKWFKDKENRTPGNDSFEYFLKGLTKYSTL